MKNLNHLTDSELNMILDIAETFQEEKQTFVSNLIKASKEQGKRISYVDASEIFFMNKIAQLYLEMGTMNLMQHIQNSGNSEMKETKADKPNPKVP